MMGMMLVLRRLTTSMVRGTAGGRLLCTQVKQVPYDTTLQDQTKRAPSSVPDSADVVVVGGGSVGCNTLYHLTKLGVRSAVLLERDQLSSGTTWHSAGLLWRLRPSDVEIEIISHTRDLCRQVLEEETALHTGWVENGGLFIAGNKERLDEYKRLMTLGKAYGIESQVLSPSETKTLYPLINTSDIYGSLYSPGDGTVDPAGFISALARASVNGGAKVIEKCPVVSVDTYEDSLGVRRVRGVVTEQGYIRTDAVVNCCGVWAPGLGNMAGVATPQVAMKHAYIVTERIEGCENKPNVRDHDASVYLKLQGDTLQVGGYEPHPLYWDDVTSDFSFSLFDLDWDVFSVHIDGAVNRIPVIGETGVKSTVCGPESFTPDHKPLLGEAPELRGFFFGCGFNSAGLMLGGGCGWQLAKWIVEGRPELDMYSYDIRRFSQKLTSNSKWVRERSHESYAKNYSILFPHDEPLASRDMKTDALHEELSQRGCFYQERLGYERPGWFSPDGSLPVLGYDYYGSYGNETHGDYPYYQKLKDEYTFDFPKHQQVIGRECLACRESVALFNMSYFGKFYLHGKDSGKAVDWIFSNDVRKRAGSTTYTCMLNKRGGIESDLTVSVVESGLGTPCDPTFSGGDGVGYYIAAGGGNAQHSLSHMRTVIEDNGWDCELLDHSDDMCMMSVQGPNSRQLLQRLLTDTDLGDDQFPFSSHKVVRVKGHKARAMRLSFVGELGFELHVPNQSAVTIYRELMKSGEEFGIVNAGYRSIDNLSIEKGYRHWHADVRSDDTPLEAGLGFTCKLKSTIDFLGREALEKQKVEGVKKRLACFTIDDPKALIGLEVIYRDGEVAGYLRRAGYGFAINKSIGYGYVHHTAAGEVVTPEYLKTGEYSLESMGEMMRATYHRHTPFDPKNMRVKGLY